MSSLPVHPACLPTEELLKQCELQRVKRSGPGGQRRNKVETGVVLTHQPTGVRAEASRARSAAENQQQALRQLRLNLALQVREPALAEKSPDELWKSRVHSGKILINPSHEDFPALIAEALELIHPQSGELKEAADRLECTPSQLLKLLKLEPAVFQRVNEWRKLAGKHLLK